MDVLGTVINFVLLLLTAAVVLFAWQTVKESRKATKAARDTIDAVGKLLEALEASVLAAQETVVEIKRASRASEDTLDATRNLLEVARDTAKASETSAVAARATAEITRAAWEAEKRYSLGANY
jgi:hypothetical protein